MSKEIWLRILFYAILLFAGIGLWHVAGEIGHYLRVSHVLEAIK